MKIIGGRIGTGSFLFEIWAKFEIFVSTRFANAEFPTLGEASPVVRKVIVDGRFNDRDMPVKVAVAAPNECPTVVTLVAPLDWTRAFTAVRILVAEYRCTFKNPLWATAFDGAPGKRS